MEKCRFGDLVKEVKAKVDRDNNPYEYFIAGEHMDTDELHLLRRGVFEGSDVGPAFIRIFKPGQVLYGSRRTYLRKVAVADFEGITSNTTFVLETKDELVLIQRLLPFIMQSDRFVQYSIKHSKGSTNPYVLFSDLADYEVELPNIEKQRELADLLWAMDDVRMSYKKLISATDELVKSQFIEMFDKYQKVSLGSIANISTGQSSPKDDEFAEDGIPFIKAGNLEGLKSHQYSEYNCNLVSEEVAKKKKLKLHDVGTILVAKSGMSCNSGHIYVLQEESYVVSHLACIKPNGRIPSNFIKVFFTVTGVQSLIKDAGYPSIQLGQFAEMQVPDAPDDVMSRFDSFVEQSDKSKCTYVIGDRGGRRGLDF